MPFQLTKTYPRLWSLAAGAAMVVTDLHGDWDRYVRYRDRFLTLRAQGQADCLIFTGDLIHREPGAGMDGSLAIVLDLLRLRERYRDAIVILCGNHELPHLYGFVLAKGTSEYTPAFEAAMSESGRRADVLALLETLPFFLRTAAGVVMAHAGASTSLADAEQALMLFNWNHQAVRAWANAQLEQGDRAELRSGYARLSGESSYAAMARRYIAVGGVGDPRYDDLLRGFMITAHPDFRALRAALFTRCEQEDDGISYAERLRAALELLSSGYAPQRALVAGHMATAGGHAIVAGRHLRLSSGAHAHPPGAAQYLLFDAARPIARVDDLVTGLSSIA
jgi:hypothetical protein